VIVNPHDEDPRWRRNSVTEGAVVTEGMEKCEGSFDSEGVENPGGSVDSGCMVDFVVGSRTVGFGGRQQPTAGLQSGPDTHYLCNPCVCSAPCSVSSGPSVV